MGETMGKLFINPATPTEGGVIPNDGYGFIQVLFLGLCYGYLLLQGSNLISDGSELLLLIPEAAGVVGSVVLPVLGAVPDGAIVLFSGLGPVEQAKSQLSIGVGALAGSTVMLITVPWFLSVLGGKVELLHGQPCYSRQQRLSLGNGARDVSAGGCGWTTSGVAPNASIRVNSVVMIITCLVGYLIVEVPALTFMNKSADQGASDVQPFAWAGAVACSAMFAGYLILQFKLASLEKASTADARAIALAQKMIAQKELSLAGALSFLAPSGPSDTAREPLAAPRNAAAIEARLRAIVRPFFNRYDADHSGGLCREELANMVADLGERVSANEIETLFTSIDADGSGSIDYEECVKWLTKISVLTQEQRAQRREATNRPSAGSSRPSEASRPSWARRPAGEIAAAADAEAGGNGDAAGEEEDEDEDEEPEVPDDIRDLPPEQQRRRVLQRACTQMGLGTLIVLLISDPMVDVLDTLGGRTGIPAFYVAFLLAPVASNASEMIASYNYAQKKTQKTISIAFAQLLGAACMNNTFCLGIFYFLVAGRNLGWTYHAEVIGILVAELAVAFIACRKVHTLLHGFLVMLLLPLCLVVVYLLKATAFKGKD